MSEIAFGPHQTETGAPPAVPSSISAPDLVLASASPRRRDLLREAGFSFRIEAVEAAELGPGDRADPWAAARENAEMKARAAVEVLASPEAVVVAADTVLCVDRGWIGKPSTRAEGARMLAALRGLTHQVVTGVALAFRGRTESLTGTTEVRIRILTEEQIRAYHAVVDPLDKAGAYDINQPGPLPGGVVEWREGSYSNVMGLPMEEVVPRLEAMGVVPCRPPE